VASASGKSEAIRIAWWNTSLAPRGRARGDADFSLAAGEVVRALLEDGRIDALFLGEVTPDDAEACLKDVCQKTVRFVRTPAGGGARRQQALAALYDPSRLSIVSDRMLADTRAGSRFETGWHLTVTAAGREDILDIVVVHWPSHLREEQGPQRGHMAASLYREFRRNRDVVIVGDFNDEPFSAALTEGLVAYRDRDLVRRKAEAFYNPFWRWLGERQHVEDELGGRLPAGTHFYRRGLLSRWFTYDQVVVSSALLGRSAWNLVEGATRVLFPETLLADDGTMRGGFDHLPIATTLTYRPESDDG
jgi:hypothetical protein